VTQYQGIHVCIYTLTRPRCHLNGHSKSWLVTPGYGVVITCRWRFLHSFVFVSTGRGSQVLSQSPLRRSWPPCPCKFLGATLSVCVGFGHVLALISWLLLRSLCPFSIHIHSLLEKFNVPPVCVRSLGVLVLVAVLLEDGLFAPCWPGQRVKPFSLRTRLLQSASAAN